MLVRPLEDADWVRFLPILRGVVSAGETYAYPEDLTSAQARELWAESPLGSPSWPSLTTARCSGRRSQAQTARPAAAMWRRHPSWSRPRLVEWESAPHWQSG